MSIIVTALITRRFRGHKGVLRPLLYFVLCVGYHQDEKDLNKCSCPNLQKGPIRKVVRLKLFLWYAELRWILLIAIRVALKFSRRMKVLVKPTSDCVHVCQDQLFLDRSGVSEGSSGYLDTHILASLWNNLVN